MSIETAFAEIGARVRVRDLPPRPVRATSPRVAELQASLGLRAPNFPTIDIRHDEKGEFFTLAVPHGVKMEVIDTDVAARHLLLMARLDTKNDKARYLCGHDERHWFVAAVPEAIPASTVEGAKLALQPTALRDATSRLPIGKRIARHNEVYRRQGEWFFVPAPDFEPSSTETILRNEPLRRDGRSKPHVVSEAVRSGGQVRYIPSTTNRGFTNNPKRAAEINNALGSRSAMTKAQMSPLADQFPEVLWQAVLVNPDMYVRGPVRHSDHSTVMLRGWHKVVVNAESLARSAAHLAFID